jgi:electron transport complex protein RnfG
VVPPPVSSWRLLATLFIAGALAGILVVAVYRITLPAIKKHAGEKLEGAVREVLRSPARWDTLYLVGGQLSRTPPAGVDIGDVTKAYVGFDASGARRGVAVQAAEPGFQEELTLMIGFDPANGAITGYTVLDEKETPGLGDKIERDTSFVAQFAGRIAPLKGVKARNAADPSQVQTITGATISSRAVIRIINHAVERWQPLLAAYEKGGTK